MLLSNEFPSIQNTAKTASFTAEVGNIYPINLSGVTADVVVTFPVSPSINQSFGFFVSATHSSGGTSTAFVDRPFFCVEPLNTTSISGVSYAAESGEGGGLYSLWLTGDLLVFLYDGSTWRVAMRDATKHKASVELITTAQTITTATPTDVLYNANVFDSTGLHSTSTNKERVYAKRAGKYQVNALVRWDTAATGIRFGEVRDQDSVIRAKYRINTTGTGDEGSPIGFVPMDARDYVFTRVYQSSGGDLNLTVGAGSSSFGNILNLVEL